MANFCKKCGKQLTAENSAEPVVSDTCKHCLGSFTWDTKVCPKCGSSQLYPMAFGYKECLSCGHEFKS